MQDSAEGVAPATSHRRRPHGATRPPRPPRARTCAPRAPTELGERLVRPQAELAPGVARQRPDRALYGRDRALRPRSAIFASSSASTVRAAAISSRPRSSSRSRCARPPSGPWCGESSKRPFRAGASGVRVGGTGRSSSKPSAPSVTRAETLRPGLGHAPRDEQSDLVPGAGPRRRRKRRSASSCERSLSARCDRRGDHPAAARRCGPSFAAHHEGLDEGLEHQAEPVLGRRRPPARRSSIRHGRGRDRGRETSRSRRRAARRGPLREQIERARRDLAASTSCRRIAFKRSVSN